MSEYFEIFQSEWAVRALIASVLVGLICGVIGCFIVLRNMALIGDALSHAILPGVVFAYVIVGGYSVLGFFVGSAIAGLLAAVLMTWIQQNSTTKDDAAIGIVFTALFSIGVMGISWISRNQGVHLDLKDFLFGNVLGVSDEDLILTGVITIYVLFSVFAFYRYLFISTFQPVIAQTMGISVKTIHYFLMLLLSFAVVASLRTVGVILVVAMLITPASTALLLSNRLRTVLFISAAVGVVSAILGLVLSVIFNTTPGPAMAVVAALLYLLAMLFAPQRGLVSRSIQKYQLNRKIQLEDALKQAFRLQEADQLSFESLRQQLGYTGIQLRRYVRLLRRKGLLTSKALVLTKKGLDEARRLVRAHRLWETYQVQKMGLSAEHIHDEAEKYEHFLTDEILDEVDHELGYPTEDPHGSPIPGRMGLPNFSLLKVAAQQQARIASYQINERVSSHLWKLGLLPLSTFSVSVVAPDHVEIESNGKQYRLPIQVARMVNVEKL